MQTPELATVAPKPTEHPETTLTVDTQSRSLTISVKKYSDDPDVDRFCVLANSGMSCLVEAGQLLVKRQGEDSKFRDKLKQACPAFTDATLETFIRLGLKEWHPAFVFDMKNPGNKRMLRLPYSVQEQYSNSSVDVLVSNDQVLKLKIPELNAGLSNQVIGKDGVRSLREQKVYVETRKVQTQINESRKPTPQKPFVINGSKVVFNPDHEFVAKELLEILTQLQK